MKDRTTLTIVCFHISAVLYVLFGVFLLLLPRLVDTSESYSSGLAVFLLLFCLALAVGVEFLAAGLRRRRFWAWIAGIVVSGIYVPSLFLPLGALGLWGLLATGSRKAFGVGARSLSTANPSLEPTAAAAGSQENPNVTGGGSRGSA